MPQTVDAHHGELIEETGLKVSSDAAPTQAGELFYYDGAWVAYDALGSFNLRTNVGPHKTTHHKSGTDELWVQNLGSGALAVGKTFQSDGSGGVTPVDYVPGFPPNREAGSYATPYSTSSGTYQQVWRYTTASLPIGIYFFAVQAWLDCTNSGNVTDARVQVDDTTTIAKWIAPVGYVGGIAPLVGVVTVSLATATTHNVDFDIRKASGNGNVIMTECYITLWRVQ